VDFEVEAFAREELERVDQDALFVLLDGKLELVVISVERDHDDRVRLRAEGHVELFAGRDLEFREAELGGKVLDALEEGEEGLRVVETLRLGFMVELRQSEHVHHSLVVAGAGQELVVLVEHDGVDLGVLVAPPQLLRRLAVARIEDSDHRALLGRRGESRPRVIQLDIEYRRLVRLDLSLLLRLVEVDLDHSDDRVQVGELYFLVRTVQGTQTKRIGIRHKEVDQLEGEQVVQKDFVEDDDRHAVVGESNRLDFFPEVQLGNEFLVV